MGTDDGSKRDARRRSLYAAAVLFLITAAFIVIKSSRDALYVAEDGIFAIPRAYILIGLLSVPQATIVLWLLGRFGGAVTRVLLTAMTAVLVFGYVPFATTGSTPLNDAFFIGVPLVFSVVFSSAWLVTSELLVDDPQPLVAAGYGRVAAGSMLGGTAGGAFASAFGGSLGPRTLLMIGAGLLIVAVVAQMLAHRQTPAVAFEDAASSDEEKPRVLSLLRDPLAQLLAGLACLGAVAGTLIDFMFYLGAATSGADPAENTTYFANVYLFVNIGAFAFQLLLGARLVRFVGLAGALGILPIALFGGGAALVFAASNFANSAVRVTEGGLRASVHRANWEQAFKRIPAAVRPAAKVLVDGVGARVGEGFAAGALLFWLYVVVGGDGLEQHDYRWIPLTIVVTTAAWIAVTRASRRWLGPADDDAPTFSAGPVPDS